VASLSVFGGRKQNAGDHMAVGVPKLSVGVGLRPDPRHVVKDLPLGCAAAVRGARPARHWRERRRLGGLLLRLRRRLRLRGGSRRGDLDRWRLRRGSRCRILSRSQPLRRLGRRPRDHFLRGGFRRGFRTTLDGRDHDLVLRARRSELERARRLTTHSREISLQAVVHRI